MRLSHLSIRNYRGIRRLELPLDHGTVLVGENCLGRSNLLDALAWVLAPDRGDELAPLRADDLHVPGEAQAPAESLLVRLTFDEAEPGAWDGDPLEAVAVVWEAGRRRLHLEVHGTGVGDADRAAPASTWFFVDADGQPLPAADEPGLLAHLRRLAPCVLLDGHGFDLRHHGDRTTPHGSPRQRLLSDLYRRLTSFSSAPDDDEVAAALADLQGELAVGTGAVDAAGSLGPSWRFATGPTGHPAQQHPSSATAAVAAWLLVGALLDHLGPRRPPHPIVAIEDAEAHLHPVPLASVWRTLAAIPAQQIVTTNSPELAAAAPLESLRRLTREPDGVAVHRVPPGLLDGDDRRRIAYHLRHRRGGALFARAWLLVEGETEFWLLPELARALGHDLAAEGVSLVEFAQCGVDPLIQVADSLGIPWHLLVDGDGSGRGYASAAQRLSEAGDDAPITLLPAKDMERTLWDAGYADVYRAHAPESPRRGRRERRPAVGQVIGQAVRTRSKPFLALAVAEAAADPDGPGVPDCLAAVIEDVVHRARRAAAGAAR